METSNNGRFSRTALSIDELIAGYVVDNVDEKKGNSRAGRSHGVDLEELELPENATLQEIREAVRMRAIEKLGLPDDASDEELIEEIDARRGFEIDKAVESGDYDRWTALMAGASDKQRLAKAITRENFGTYRELEKNIHIAEDAAEELEIPPSLRNTDLQIGPVRHRFTF